MMPTRRMTICAITDVSPLVANTAALTPKVIAIAIVAGSVPGIAGETETETTRVDTAHLAPTACWRMAVPLSPAGRRR